MNFKVDDWVRVNTYPNGKEIIGKIYSIGCYFNIFAGGTIVYSAEESEIVEVWRPQEGEFIIPENFSKSSTDSFEVIKWRDSYTFKCEPFIGTLPTFIKENNEN